MGLKTDIEVELLRDATAALISLNLPSVATRRNKTVKADLLLGEGGMAYAIRLLQ